MQTTTLINGSRTEIYICLYPQSNGLVELQNRTMKNSLLKFLEDNPEMWPQIIEGILFPRRVSQRSSANYSPFMLMYNREPVFPINVKHNLNKDESKEPENREGEVDEEQPFDLDFFDVLFSSATKIRPTIVDDAADNIKAAQKK